MKYSNKRPGATRSRGRGASARDPRQLVFDFSAPRPLEVDPLDRRQRRRLAEHGLRGAVATVIGEQLFNIGGAE